MTNIVSIDTHPTRLRPGAMALHTEYGWVEILERAGSRRKIRWIGHPQLPRPLPHVEATDVTDLALERLLVWEEWVEAHSLKDARPSTAGDRSVRRTDRVLPAFSSPPAGPRA